MTLQGSAESHAGKMPLIIEMENEITKLDHGKNILIP